MPAGIDTGDTAWMLAATALVMLMTLSGGALFCSSDTDVPAVSHGDDPR